jgi:hypothetical protein
VAALAGTFPTAAGILWSPATMSTSDTISMSLLGANGAWLIVINASGSSNTLGYTDAGRTPASSAPAAFTNAIATGTTEAMYLSPKLIDPNIGTLTVTNTQSSGITYVLLPLG